MITINSNPTTDNVFLPHVLQDRKPRAHSGSHASTLNEPEISFSTLNQGRNVKTSSSSTNSSEEDEDDDESNTSTLLGVGFGICATVIIAVIICLVAKERN